MFRKKSLDYEKKESVSFVAECDPKMGVVHPTFTIEEYINAIAQTGWTISSVHEKYGKDAESSEVKPYRVPTSIFFVLKKQ